MIMKKILIDMKPIIIKSLPAVLLLLAVALSGCERSEPNFPIDVEYSTVGKGELYGNGAENLNPQTIVITDSIEWEKLIVQMDSRNNVSDSFIEKNIDFNKYIVIVAIDSIRPHSGYKINIDKIQEFKNKVQADIIYQQSEEGYNVITQPFIIVKTSKYSKEVIFTSKIIKSNQ